MSHHHDHQHESKGKEGKASAIEKGMLRATQALVAVTTLLWLATMLLFFYTYKLYAVTLEGSKSADIHADKQLERADSNYVKYSLYNEQALARMDSSLQESKKYTQLFAASNVSINRAYVFEDFRNMFFDLAPDTARLNCHFTVQNVGRTPALNFRGFGIFGGTADVDNKNINQNEIATKSRLPSNLQPDERRTVYEARFPMTKELWYHINNGVEPVWVVCSFSYDDVFGGHHFGHIKRKITANGWYYSPDYNDSQ